MNFIKFLLNLFVHPPTESTPPLIQTPQPTFTNTVNGQPPPQYLWDNRAHSVHSVRLLCDSQGLFLTDKNVLCAVIMGESAFNNNARNENKNSKGVVTSVDYGICQINSRFHIGHNLDFPSADYVLNNPDKCVLWMIKMYKAGLINLWCAYQNGSYKKYLILF